MIDVNFSAKQHLSVDVENIDLIDMKREKILFHLDHHPFLFLSLSPSVIYNNNINMGVIIQATTPK